MNRLIKNSIKWIIAIIVIIGMKYAGDIEYRDDVIGSMSQEMYNKILLNLGGTASEREICDEYISNKSEYESFGI